MDIDTAVNTIEARMRFDLGLWLDDAIETGAYKSTDQWVKAAFEAGFSAALQVAAEEVARQREEDDAETNAQRARDKCIGAHGYDLDRLK